MKYTLENIKAEFIPEMPYGTCEMCMHTGPYEELVYLVRDENGESYRIERSLMIDDWETDRLPDVDNVIDFANWLKDQDVEEEMGRWTFRDLMERYNMLRSVKVHPVDTVVQFMALGDQLPGLDEPNLHEFLNRVDDEMVETYDAIEREDQAETLDGFLDIAYAALTAAVATADRPVEARMAWDAVVEANLSKVDGRFGPVQRSKHGKILKPEGFKAPDIQGILKNIDEVELYERFVSEGEILPYLKVLAHKADKDSDAL
ncbi:hypothetical protein [Corynebacterium propinquum]